MGDVINLGRARKRKQQQARAQRASANAIVHGRTKAEKQRDRLERTRQQEALDGARREPAEGPDPGADSDSDSSPDPDQP
ncbi:MAG: DUF4169 family protein [Myxococcales bacterium]|nr:DUF4169 family protein [Myxococcales bacterium]